MDAIYSSAWHHPGIAWLCNGLLLVFGMRRVPGYLRPYMVIALAGICFDAWLTGAFAPPLARTYAKPVGLVFVLLGDLRYFYLLERFTRTDAPRARVLAVATALSFIVPLWQAAVIELWPGPFQSGRVIFLSYEALFVLVCVMLWQAYYAPKLTRIDARSAIFLQRITAFELVQYISWAIVDVLILDGHAWALALRIFPNTLYYGGFLWFVAAEAPREP
jgi:hypothetical protein